MKEIGVKSVICVPLVGKTGTSGAIYLQSVNVAHGFRKNDLFLITSLSTPIALAIENAMLYAKNKGAEERLQQASDNLEKEVMNRTSELKIAKDNLEQLSITDGLTGLHNYRYLIHSLDGEFRRVTRYNHTLALLLMDIDYFKNLNDTYGHLCGDNVLKTVGKLLRTKVRSTDIVARYGGDELAVILIETNTKSAHEVAEKLKEEIGNYIFQWQTKQLSVNAQFLALLEKLRPTNKAWVEHVQARTTHYLNFLQYPAGLRPHLRSTHLPESLNNQIENLRRNAGGHFHTQRETLIKMKLLTDRLGETRWRRPCPHIITHLAALTRRFQNHFEAELDPKKFLTHNF